MNTPDDVPVVDFESISNGTTDEEVNAQIDAACRVSGFFYLANTGIEQKVFDELWSVTRWFFALPMKRKLEVERDENNSRGFYNQELTKNIRDMKEVFDFGHKPVPDLADDHPKNLTYDGWNQWPTGPGSDRFQALLSSYYERCTRIAFDLLKTISMNLGASPDELAAGFDPGHSSFLRLNYYPMHDPLHGAPGRPAAATGHMGVHHHSDAGALTLLLQDQVGGLEVLIGDLWTPVEPKPGTLIVNIGDIVQVWSNDAYRAPLHRVVASASADRYSLPFFFNPSYATTYAPLDGMSANQSQAHYRPINWGNFRKERQHGDYGDYGSEIQISDFRIEGVV
jgi:isopenicillin N synthase-like dioxygenase